MTIHVVQQGETINSIAEKYDVSTARVIRENELRNPDDLAPGQTIVITYPDRTYTVIEGDTLEGIANKNNITLMQLLANNPYLIEREYIYPGETLTISYIHEERLNTIGYALPFINQTILRKTLPYLTYLFVYNYRLDVNGEVDTFYDDTDIIEASIEYGTVPIMTVTTLTAQGTQNVQAAYEILLNEDIQVQLIDNILQILREKGYYGFNMTFLYLTETSLDLYNNFTRRVSNRLTSEGYLVFVTVNPGISESEDGIEFAAIDYSNIGSEVRGISFISYVWGTNIMPPAPVNSITNTREFLDYVSTMVSSEKIFAGIQIIAYDWEIPFVSGFSKANALTVVGAVDLAVEVGAVIQFDEQSQSPYFEYVKDEGGYLRQHLVWFVDARTVNSLSNLVIENNYGGPSVWNIMNYNPQLWLIFNSQFEIEKFI